MTNYDIGCELIIVKIGNNILAKNLSDSPLIFLKRHGGTKIEYRFCTVLHFWHYDFTLTTGSFISAQVISNCNHIHSYPK